MMHPQSSNYFILQTGPRFSVHSIASDEVSVKSLRFESYKQTQKSSSYLCISAPESYDLAFSREDYDDQLINYLQFLKAIS